MWQILLNLPYSKAAVLMIYIDVYNFAGGKLFLVRGIKHTVYKGKTDANWRTASGFDSLS